MINRVVYYYNLPDLHLFSVPNVLNCSLQIINRPFVPSLNDPSSPAFKSFKHTLESLVSLILKSLVMVKIIHICIIFHLAYSQLTSVFKNKMDGFHSLIIKNFRWVPDNYLVPLSAKEIWYIPQCSVGFHVRFFFSPFSGKNVVVSFIAMFDQSVELDKETVLNHLMAYLLKHWTMIGVYQVDVQSVRINCKFE